MTDKETEIAEFFVTLHLGSRILKMRLTTR